MLANKKLTVAKELLKLKNQSLFPFNFDVMEIVCLGTGDAFGSGGKLNACFWVKSAQASFLLDCGTTALIALKKLDITSNQIDGIVLSHLHGDHFGGLPFLLRETQVAAPREKKLTIIGPPGTEQRVYDALNCFFPSDKNGFAFELDFVEYAPGEKFKWNGVEIEPFTAIHTAGTQPHSLRLTVDEKTIAYSGDTEWNENLIALCAGADLFICEGYSLAEAKKNHLWLGDLLEHLPALTAKKIVLTHAGPDVIAAAPNLPLALLRDGDRLTV